RLVLFAASALATWATTIGRSPGKATPPGSSRGRRNTNAFRRALRFSTRTSGSPGKQDSRPAPAARFATVSFPVPLRPPPASRPAVALFLRRDDWLLAT